MNHVPHEYLDSASGRAHRFFRMMMMIGAGVVFASLFALLFSIIVMTLWNWLLPSLFGVKAISFWQAFGITILAKILFGGCRSFHPMKHHERMHQHARSARAHWNRWNNRTTDDQNENAIPAEDIQYYRSFWKEQGAKAFDAYVREMRSKENPARDK